MKRYGIVHYGERVDIAQYQRTVEATDPRAAAEQILELIGYTIVEIEDGDTE